jgi:hypothetical protein
MTITALFLFAVLGIVAIGAWRPNAKAKPPAQREEATAQTAVHSPEVA